MLHKSYNALVYAIAKRAKALADEPIDALRGAYPETTDTQAELVRFCRESRFSRGDMVEAILAEEFVEETDAEFEQ